MPQLSHGPTRGIILYVAISGSLFVAEWLTKLLSSSLMDEVALVGAVVIGLAFARITRNLQKVQRPQDAAVYAGLMFALLFGANLLFLHWLFVETADSSAAMEFGWFLPFYVSIIWVGGSASTAFLAAIFAQMKE